MPFYATHILPRLVDAACGVDRIREQRAVIVPRAEGVVLDVGLGSGHNLALYVPARVARVMGLEPSAEMRRLAVPRTGGLGFPFEFLDAPAAAIPLDARSVDTVVLTYTLCTVPDPDAALREIERVLRPGGQLLFCEHGAAPDASVRRWQDRLTPVWKRLAGGCHLNRDVAGLVEAAGLELVELETMYLPGWKPAGYTYKGRAVPRRSET